MPKGANAPDGRRKKTLTSIERRFSCSNSLGSRSRPHQRCLYSRLEQYQEDNTNEAVMVSRGDEFWQRVFDEAQLDPPM